MIDAEDVLEFWFNGDLTKRRKVWFEKDAEFDATCERFSEICDAAKLGVLDHWSETARGALALIILLDKLSRNRYRDSPEAFAADPKARQIARTAIAQGFDRQVPPAARGFFYLPFEHSEDLADQEESVRLFEALGGEDARYAKLHHNVISRFGRFPHRNAVLGRANLPAEVGYIADPDREF